MLAIVVPSGQVSCLGMPCRRGEAIFKLIVVCIDSLAVCAGFTGMTTDKF